MITDEYFPDEFHTSGKVNRTVLKQPECSKRSCKHFMGVKGEEPDQKVFCKAFPDGIPNEIAYGPNKHLTPVNGDHGIQFEAE